MAINKIELDITLHVPCYNGQVALCIVYLHKQGEWDTESMCKDCLFIVIYELIISHKKYNDVCNVMINCLLTHSSIFWFLFLISLKFRK